MVQDWPAQSSELWPIEKITPYARNSRTHSDEQVAQIAASIREWGWTNPILVDEDGGLIAGHGRLLAARKLGLTQIPTMVAKGWSEAYYTEFSYNKGRHPLVVSYATSPAAEVFYSKEKITEPPTGNLFLKGGVFRQVEGVALVKAGGHR